MQTKPVTIYPDEDLLEWIDDEATKARRSRTKQIEYFLEEQRRVVTHNRKAMSDRTRKGA